MRVLTAADPAHLERGCRKRWATIDALEQGDRARLVAPCASRIVPARDVYSASPGLRRRSDA